MADGFLGRWSKRKQDGRDHVRQGLQPAESTHTQDASKLVSSLTDQSDQVANIPSSDSIDANLIKQAELPLPSMEDVRLLNAESDFAPFVARNVSSEVRNSAMKKLFSDPHYNVMDRLDIYIDDYSKPDPLPLAMLRQMASAKFLNLFDDDDQVEKASSDKPLLKSGESVNAKNVAQSDVEGTPKDSNKTNVNTVIAEQETQQSTTYDHTDMRLRQDHAAEPHKSGRGAE